MPSTVDAASEPSRHIAIVGGGIIGASTAYYLSQSPIAKGARVTLIEEAPSVAPAASGKSGGFLAEDWHGPDTADLGRLSFALHKELAERDGGKDKWGYRNVETLSVKFDDSKSRSSNKCPKDLATWVDGKYITSSSNMGGGGTTAQATPLPLVEHLIEQAKASGRFDLLCSTRAEKLDMDEDGRVKALQVTNVNDKSQQTLNVDDVVVAAGPWTGKLLRSLLSSAPSTSLPRYITKAMRIDGSRAHSIVVEAPQATTAHCLFTDMHYKNGVKAGAPEVYCRGDGTVYACGGSDSVALPASAVEVSYDKRQTASLIEQVAHLAPSHLTQDVGASITREQACYLPVGPSGPIVAGDARTGLYVAAGHSCWGITLGLGTGKVMRELLYNEPLSADISALR